MNKIAIFLCDITGTMGEPWVSAGYDIILVDPQHPVGITVELRENAKITRVGHIIDHPTTWRVLHSAIATGNVVFVAGFPPCTDLAVSGARWFEAKRKADPAFQFKAMQVVWQCQLIGELAGAVWVVENPVSQISSLWRKPDYFFHPSDYTGYCAEDNYTKKTCLWASKDFVMPKMHKDATLGAPDDRIHKAPPGPERANFRSATPMGFSIANFLANAPHLKQKEKIMNTSVTPIFMEDLKRGVVSPWQVYAYEVFEKLKHGVILPNGHAVNGFDTHESASSFMASLKLASGV